MPVVVVSHTVPEGVEGRAPLLHGEEGLIPLTGRSPKLRDNLIDNSCERTFAMPVTFPAAPEGVPPPGLYSHISIGTGSEIVALSGQTGRDASGTFAVGDIAAQAEQAFATIGQLLSAAGVDWSAVVSFRTYVVGQHHLPAYRSVRERLYTDIYPDGRYPANTLLVVAALGREEALVEIETLAIR
jgi:2-iminobutanoate/2-iminopropanoate deaminase